MAKNKSRIDRQIKTDEIEVAAASLFMERGFDGTSMTMIATAANVAPNTLYWYYKSKDDMLVAVLNRLLAAGVAGLNGLDDEPLTAQLLYTFQQFEQVSNLISTVHARADRSEVINQWHSRFHLLLESILVQKLSARGMPLSKAKLMATVGTFVVEGLLSHPHSENQRNSVMSWLAGEGDLR